MKCPVCKSILISENIAGGEMYFCPEKHGVCINADYLGDVIRSLAAQSGTPHAEIRDVFHLSGPDRAVDEKRSCPDCGTEMNTFNYAYNSNIFLDRCFECGNVWIDAKEFPPLLSYVKGNPKIDNLVKTVSEYEAANIAEKRNTENMISASRSMNNFGNTSLLGYIGWKLKSKRTSVFAKIFWLIILLTFAAISIYIARH